MTGNILCFLAGMPIGACIGLLASAICYAAKDAAKPLDEEKDTERAYDEP